MLKTFIIGLMLFSLPATSYAAKDPLKKVAKKMADVIKKHKKNRIAILAFPYHDGKVSSGSSIVSERLTTHMVFLKGIRVVERSLIVKLLEEQRVSETGAIDPTTARELGKILGVDVILTGTLIDLGNDKTEINARGLKSDTGEILAASRTIIDTAWKDRPRMARPKWANVKFEAEDTTDQENKAIEVGTPQRRGYRGRSRGYSRGGYRR